MAKSEAIPSPDGYNPILCTIQTSTAGKGYHLMFIDRYGTVRAAADHSIPFILSVVEVSIPFLADLQDCRLVVSIWILRRVIFLITSISCYIYALLLLFDIY
jgi:hypothetical protein